MSAGLKGKDKLWLGTRVCCILSRWDNRSPPQIPFYCIPPYPDGTGKWGRHQEDRKKSIWSQIWRELFCPEKLLSPVQSCLISHQILQRRKERRKDVFGCSADLRTASSAASHPLIYWYTVEELCWVLGVWSTDRFVQYHIRGLR